MERLAGKAARGLVVEGVAKQRVADVVHVDADLVGAAGFEVEFEVGEARVVGEGAVMGHGAFAGGKIDGPLDQGAVEAGDRGVDGAGLVGPSEGEGLVSAVDFAEAHSLGKDGGA